MSVEDNLTGIFASIDEAEAYAREALPPTGFGTHFGAYGEPSWETNSNNLDAFRDWVIKPYILKGVSTPSLTTSVLGTPSSPIIIAPSGGQQRFHRDGELAVAAGAAMADVIMVLSTMSTFTIEEVAAAAPTGRRWFQLYILRSRATTQRIVERAEAAGYEALVLTVDNISGHLARPKRYRIYGISGPGDIVWPTLDPDRQLANFAWLRGTPEMPAAAYGDFFDPGVTWKDISWLRSITSLPIVLKGVQTAEDALLAVDHGLDAIVLSNHGGTPTAMDGLAATLDQLPEVVAAAGDMLEVYLDGGIRRGADIFKALSLGARAVLVGRAPLWGLAAAGREGVRDVVRLLEDELRSTLCIAGVEGVSELSNDNIAPAARRR